MTNNTPESEARAALSVLAKIAAEAGHRSVVEPPINVLTAFIDASTPSPWKDILAWHPEEEGVLTLNGKRVGFAEWQTTDFGKSVQAYLCGERLDSTRWRTKPENVRLEAAKAALWDEATAWISPPPPTQEKTNG